MTTSRATSLAAELRDSELHLTHDIGSLTTYRVGGVADLFVDVESTRDLLAIARWAVRASCPVLVIGAGSNLLVPDDGFGGLAIRLGESFRQVLINNSVVTAGAAVALPVAARRAVAAGLTGFEWAVGVPGTIGGAVRMNAGGHGSDMAASVLDVHGVDLSTGNEFSYDAGQLDFGYRTSALQPHHCVVRARLQLSLGAVDEGLDTMAEIVRWRRVHQPGGQNAGSVFVNPAGDSAGRLIDAAGCKGLRVGGAEVSTKHANFIQASPGATTADVIELMARVVRRVDEDFSVRLTSETHIVRRNILSKAGPAQGDGT